MGGRYVPDVTGSLQGRYNLGIEYRCDEVKEGASYGTDFARKGRQCPVSGGWRKKSLSAPSLFFVRTRVRYRQYVRYIAAPCPARGREGSLLHRRTPIGVRR